MIKVAVLGASGMLGSAVVEALVERGGYEITAVARNPKFLEWAKVKVPSVKWAQGGTDWQTRTFDLAALGGAQWIVNAVGITKPLIRDDNPEEVERAVWVNGILPAELARIAERQGAQVLQIATDCVYTGLKGGYVESDLHEATDVYGKTKSIGETYLPQAHHLRCSIIGPEITDKKFLLEWFLKQPQGGTVKGFLNHQWNGVTTLHFGRICDGVMKKGIVLPHLQHVIPTATISKAEMLEVFARAYGRSDIKIEKVNAATVVDRTLATSDAAKNKEIWTAAGYPVPPTVEQMIVEMSQFKSALRE